MVRKTERLDMRVTPEVKRLAVRLAELDRRKLTDWIEQIILEKGEQRNGQSNYQKG